MRHETRTLYGIHELSDAARQDAIERHRNVNVTFDDWTDYVYDDFLTIAAALGFRVDRKAGISWSGFGCQGDGASFRGGYEYSPGWRDAIAAHCPTDADIFAIGESLDAIRGDVGSAQLRTGPGGYCHEYTMGAECYTPDGERDSSDAGAVEFLDAARRLARWLYRQLKSEWIHQTGDEAVADCLDANGYEFTEDGRDA